MKVTVVGASGNLGTAVLEALRDEPTVTAVEAVARRAPTGRPPPPYDVARWTSIDIGRTDDDVVARLTRVFEGSEVVVLLAWAIQPSHDRDRLRQVNVEGARRVLAAVARAGVPRVVVASSVGAYSGVHDDEPRDEGWATGGVRSSAYSVDKVAVERLLDRAEDEHPGLSIARLRPALVFPRGAGAAIERYFLGPMVPARLLRHRLPVLPWPQGLRLQAVHAKDVGEAFRSAVTRGVTGPFNLAGPGILRAPEVAGLVGASRVVEVPRRAVRGAVALGWTARALSVSPGWVDLALHAPLLSTDRARTELGWHPRRTAAQAVAEIVDGLAHGAGTASPVLRPRSRSRPSSVGGQSAQL